MLTESPPQKIPVYTTESLAEATNMRYWDVKPLTSSGRSTYCNARQKCSTYLNARKKMFDKPYDILVLVFACPNQWSPTAIILKTEESVISFLYDVKRGWEPCVKGQGVTLCVKVRVKIHKVMRIHMNFSKGSAKNYGLYKVQDPNNHENRPKCRLHTKKDPKLLILKAKLQAVRYTWPNIPYK